MKIERFSNVGSPPKLDARSSPSTPGSPFVMIVLMVNVVLWLSLACSGEVGSLMELDDPASHIAGVSIEPASTTLEVGETEVLSAQSSDQQAEDVDWSSTRPDVARVSQEGEVAALSPGTAVIVAYTDHGEQGSADVEVLEQVEENGEDGGERDSGPGSHEPGGFELVTERGFEQAVEDGWTSSGGIDMQIVSDPAAPRSPSSVGRIRYPSGFEGGRTPTFTTRSGLESEGHRKLYISFWVKLSENWQGHETRVNKVGFIWMHGDPVVVPNNHVVDQERIRTELRLQVTPDGSRNLSANLADREVKRGEWHRWEIVLVANSGSSRDGEAHWWIDGEKVGEYTDVIYGGSSESKVWQTVAWRPTWGGAGDAVKEEMYMWMDHIYVSGSD